MTATDKLYIQLHTVIVYPQLYAGSRGYYPRLYAGVRGQRNIIFILYFIRFFDFTVFCYLQSRTDRAVKHRPAERLIKARDGFGRSV